MNIRIYNARILTMEEDHPIFLGEVQVRGNRISYVGSGRFKEERNFVTGISGEKRSTGSEGCVETSIVWDREINANGNLIMPGFKNAHTHSAMTFLRSYADDMSLSEWLNTKVFPTEARLTPDDIYHLCKLAIMEYLTSGITANFDMYLTPDTMAQASFDCGFRTVICGAINRYVQSIPEVEHWYQTYSDPEKLVTYRLGFHAEYTNSYETLQQLAELVEKYKAPIYTHSSESASEVAECMERYGKTPTELFDGLGLFNYGGGCFHCVHMTEEDLRILEQRGVGVITNPASNLKLASGIADIAAMLRHNIPLAIGTDGPASNNCLDMFREMFLVTALAKYRENDASVVSADAVLEMATVGGARAMGLADADVLAAGKFADLIMIDLQQPNMRPIHNIKKNLVYSGSKQNVKLTMVNGKILYEDGKFDIGIEPEEVYRKVEQIVKRIVW